MEYLERACPICKSRVAKVDIVSPKRAEEQSYHDLVPYWNGFFKGKSVFSYSRCTASGLLYAPIYFSEEQLMALYGQMPPNMDLVPEALLKKTQHQYFREFEDLIPEGGGYLELGPDVGFFAKRCIESGKFNEYWLYEPNLSVHRHLEAITEGNKIQIVADMSGFERVPDNSLSLIVMVQVLDHLLDPLATLKSLRSKLKEDGVIMVVSHDERSFLSKLLAWKWPAYCLQHPQLYNQSTVRNLFEASGYWVVKQKKTRNYFPLSFLAKHAFWACGIRLNAVPIFWGVEVGLKLGNIMAVAKLKV